MINWVVSGIIFGLTVYIVIRAIARMRKGLSSCCGDCAKSQCDCSRNT